MGHSQHRTNGASTPPPHTHGTAPWIEHVSSAAQLADAVSRADLAAATKLGWQGWDLELAPLWDLLAEVIADGVACKFAQAVELEARCGRIWALRTPIALG